MPGANIAVVDTIVISRGVMKNIGEYYINDSNLTSRIFPVKISIKKYRVPIQYSLVWHVNNGFQPQIATLILYII